MADKSIYMLDVSVVSGPMADKFAKKNKVISRTIEIRGDQTLEELHDAIFEAFDRWEEHMYEFQIGGRGPMDRKARRYVLPGAMEDPFLTFSDRPAPCDLTRAVIGSLGLNVGDAFGYWFDFGDDWWHQINVVSIEAGAGQGDYPRITKRVGSSPPQYIGDDEEE